MSAPGGERLLDGVAASLEYPGPETAKRARSTADRAATLHAELARALWHLAVYLETAPVGEAEERYTRLFDMSPVCTLHVGYHLFGDTYQRGAFLSGMGAELRRAGLGEDARSDLPDFLPTLLRLVERVAEPESRRLLVEAALAPALERMGAALRDAEAPWREVLAALPPVLEESVGRCAPAVTQGVEDARA